MYSSGYRYFLERQRHDLALRMIRHEARTCTIQSCTGLTEDRIRRLYKTYATDQQLSAVRRRRGRSPRQTSFFTRSTLLQYESSLLVGVFMTFGLLSSMRVQPDEPCEAWPVELGDRFCDAYETHLQLLSWGSVSFEHAWFLLQLLNGGTGLTIARCRRCDSRYLRDEANPLQRSCPTCKIQGGRTGRLALRRTPGR